VSSIPTREASSTGAAAVKAGRSRWSIAVPTVPRLGADAGRREQKVVGAVLGAVAVA
jgi:hypothetical protein